MLNTVLGIAFVVVALAAFVWRTFGDARAVADGVKPDAAGPSGIGMAGSDFSGIAGGVGGGTAGGDGGGEAQA